MSEDMRFLHDLSLMARTDAGARHFYREAVQRYRGEMAMRLYHARRKIEDSERWRAEDERTSFMSGTVRVDVKIDERCRVCRSARDPQTCYRVTLRTPHYDWRTKTSRLVKLKLRHVHLSPHDERNVAIDSKEAYRKIARAALSFGSYWDKEYGREHGVSEDAANTVSDAMDRTESGEPLLNDERYPRFTDQGGYPIIYVTSSGDVFCGNCAPRFVTNDTRHASVFYEGSPETCGQCGEEIESAYGDPDEPEEDDTDEDPPAPLSGSGDADPPHGACAG